jgi:hypothetical protein
VLISSGYVPNGQWHIKGIKEPQQPQVWMAAFSTMANALLSYAFAEGMAVNVWRLANHGTTVTNAPVYIGQSMTYETCMQFANAFGVPTS